MTFSGSLDVALSLSADTFLSGFSPILSLQQSSAIHNENPEFLVNDILPPFNGTIEGNNTQTSLIFSNTRRQTEDFPRSKDHLGDPCASGEGLGVEDWIEDLRWGGGTVR